MSGGVILARVSLNEKLLAVTDHRGVIVLVSEDACWALGVPGPAASLVGSSLLDHLTPEDQTEYRNAMRRRSGSLLRLRKQGCFVWLDISHYPYVTSRMKQALHRIERARAASRCEKPSRHTLYNHGHARADNEFHKQHSSSQHRQQHQQHGDAAIAQHVLSKERPLEWFLEPSAGGKGEEDDELAAAADSLECMSLHPSGPSSSSRSSATASDDDLLAAYCWDDDENFVTPPQELYEAQQREEQADPQQAASVAHMYKEYSFRDIFEYALGGRPSQGSRASNLNLASSLDSAASAGSKGGKSSSGSSKGSKMSLSSTAAAARAVAAVVLKAGQPKRSSGAINAAPSRSAVAAKCRAAPESSPGAASYAPAQTQTYSTSWRSVGGYMAQRAAATVAGLSGASASVASHVHGHQQGGGDDGWGLYVDLDIVG